MSLLSQRPLAHLNLFLSLCWLDARPISSSSSSSSSSLARSLTAARFVGETAIDVSPAAAPDAHSRPVCLCESCSAQLLYSRGLFCQETKDYCTVLYDTLSFPNAFCLGCILVSNTKGAWIFHFPSSCVENTLHLSYPCLRAFYDNKCYL